MESAGSLEDERGVDLGQIRAQLRLSVKERVAGMVSSANLMMNAREFAHAARERKLEQTSE